MIRLFSITSRPSLEPTQPPIKWVLAALFPEESGRNVKVTTHIYLVPRLRIVEFYLHSLICLEGEVLD
jgi:hypothetical protein